jgi:hypothetical protein
MKQGEWLRCAALDKLPPIIPEPNIEKWQALARSAANLNQLAKTLNLVKLQDSSEENIDEIRNILTEFRASLVEVSRERDAKN